MWRVSYSLIRIVELDVYLIVDPYLYCLVTNGYLNLSVVVDVINVGFKV